MLVPEGRQEITTEGGLDVAGQEARLAGDRRPARRRRASSPACSSTPSCGRSRPRRASARASARSTPAPTRTRSTPKGRDPESAAVVAELAKIRDAGAAIRALGMRFNAGHALNYFNVQPVAALPGVRELHIGHAIVSRSVFVGMREAVRQMKALLREAAARWRVNAA